MLIDIGNWQIVVLQALFAADIGLVQYFAAGDHEWFDVEIVLVYFYRTVFVDQALFGIIV